MNGIKIGFPLEENKEIIPEDIHNARYLYIVKIQDGSPDEENWFSFNEIKNCGIDVFIVCSISDDIKKYLKNKGILILQTEARNYKEALLGYATGMKRFKPL